MKSSLANKANRKRIITFFILVLLLYGGGAFFNQPFAAEEKKEEPQKSTNPAVVSLEKKLELLSKELEGEADHAKQQDILKSINSLIETIEKIKNKQ